ncbi:hypothetical protein FA95DRAFT_1218465 [Auriscalpium vulgare]|uniref:Uncharacterized protein n=1 Tax=Auriscalpium vulgare TaxID=40419 RepID=A0ACB8RTG4_9AGAM|nr:hypothetical protein FA95DRAFT_1218465 [Auriscalpium vulgare]
MRPSVPICTPRHHPEDSPTHTHTSASTERPKAVKAHRARYPHWHFRPAYNQRMKPPAQRKKRNRTSGDHGGGNARKSKSNLTFDGISTYDGLRVAQYEYARPEMV